MTDAAPFDASPACWGWPVPTDGDRERARQKRAFLAKYEFNGKPILDRLIPAFVMIDFQQERCAICGLRAALVEDHDHATGLVRGYLCRRCNGLEGLHPEPEARIFREYRERNPASICGVVEYYYDAYKREYARPASAARPLDMDGDDNPLLGIGM